MLNNIKSMILEKKEFQDAASIIFEDGIGNLDDQIVLGEENEMPDQDSDTEPTEPIDHEDEPGEPEDEGPEDTEPPAEEPASTPETPEEPVSDPAPAQPEPGPSEEPMGLPGDGDELPTPVGKQTGEPIEDKDDLLDVSIDLKSNTIRDVLPVPPANASEALGGEEDDLLDQRIDSGFGGDNEPSSEPAPQPEVDMNPAQPPENTETPEEPVAPVESGEPEEQMTEAITLGNDAPAGDPAPEADTPGDTADTPPDDGTEPPAEENSVTSAVKDKVDEITSDEGGDNTSVSKDDLLKKLGNITKSLEDAKKAVMNTLQ